MWPDSQLKKKKQTSLLALWKTDCRETGVETRRWVRGVHSNSGKGW